MLFQLITSLFVARVVIESPSSWTQVDSHHEYLAILQGYLQLCAPLRYCIKTQYAGLS